jgi:hypothetical protein
MNMVKVLVLFWVIFITTQVALAKKYVVSVSGNDSNNGPGEHSVIDFSATSFGTRGVSLSGNYWHIKGFDFINAGDNGMIISSGGNNVIEFCSFIGNRDSGLQLSGGTHDNKINQLRFVLQCRTNGLWRC